VGVVPQRGTLSLSAHIRKYNERWKSFQRSFLFPIGSIIRRLNVASVSSSITINQPVDKVFNYVITVENHKAWQEGIVDAKVAPAGPVAVGSTYQYTSKMMGIQMQTQMQVSAFEPKKQWNITTVGVPTPVTTAYQFEGDGSTTKLTISMELTGGYPAAAEAAVKQQMQKSLDEQANRIKKIVGG
jgi:hypothetical protein